MPDSLEAFTVYISGEKAENTVQSYRRDVKKYLDYLAGHGIYDIEKTTGSTVMTYLVGLKIEGMAPSSANRSLSSIRAFYTFVTDGGRKMPDPTRAVRTPHTDRRAPRVLTPQEAERLLSAPDPDTPKGIRDRAMLELLYAGGLRVSELVRLDTDDVSLEKGFVRCGGGSAERVLPLGRPAAGALERYLAESRPVLCADEGERALFLSCSGTRMTRQGFWKLLKVCKERADFLGHYAAYPQALLCGAYARERRGRCGSVGAARSFRHFHDARIFEAHQPARQGGLLQNSPARVGKRKKILNFYCTFAADGV